MTYGVRKVQITVGTFTTKDAIVGVIIFGMLIIGGCLVHDYLDSFEGSVIVSIGIGFYIASFLWFWVDNRRKVISNSTDKFPDADYAKWMRTRYPGGIPVFYDIDELLQAIKSKSVDGTVGIPYHVVTGGPASDGMRLKDSPRWGNELRLQYASSLLAPDGEVIVLIAIRSWMERCL